MQATVRKDVETVNALPASKRILMRRDAATVQTIRQCGYVFDADNRLIPVQRPPV